jgi:hypothetical protein
MQIVFHGDVPPQPLSSSGARMPHYSAIVTGRHLNRAAVEDCLMCDIMKRWENRSQGGTDESDKTGI